MQGNMFISAGSTKADDDVRVASAPYGQLLDKNALKPLLSGKRFDCTRNDFTRMLTVCSESDPLQIS